MATAIAGGWDRDMDDDAKDRMAVALYREYSEDSFCAGWYSLGYTRREEDDIIAWYKRERERTDDGADMEDYEREALPFLRRVFDRAAGELSGEIEPREPLPPLDVVPFELRKLPKGPYAKELAEFDEAVREWNEEMDRVHGDFVRWRLLASERWSAWRRAEALIREKGEDSEEAREAVERELDLERECNMKTPYFPIPLEIETAGRKIVERRKGAAQEQEKIS